MQQRPSEKVATVHLRILAEKAEDALEQAEAARALAERANRLPRMPGPVCQSMRGRQGVRTVADGDGARLYRLDDDGVAATLFYGPLAGAMEAAALQPDAVQDQLYLQTANDVVAYRDLAAG